MKSDRGVKLLLAAASAAVLAGCASPVPVAENFPLSYQKVARTAHHWDVVADDVVEQTTAKVGQIAAMNGRPIYVTPPAINTTFDAAFRDFMLNRMLQRGLTVNACPIKQTAGFSQPPAIQVSYSTRVVQHSAAMPNYQPGVLTALGAGVFAIHELALKASLANQYAAGVGFGIVADIAAGRAAEPTRTEIIVTTTIVENNRFVVRRSDVYYVPDADAHLFSKRVARADECNDAAQSAAQTAIDDEKRELNAKLERLVRFNPDWRGTLYSEKDFGVEGPVFVKR